MSVRNPPHVSAEILRRPGDFAMRVLRGFRANQGMLLAGAVAYYALLSLAPLLILILIALSHVVEEALLLATLGEYLEFAVPGQSSVILAELRGFLAHRDIVGGVLLATLIVFSAMAFTVLENAMSVIFFHRVAIRRRHFLVSAILPYLFILLLGVGLLVVTLVSGALQAMGQREIALFGATFSLVGVSAALIYLLGVSGEILMLTAIYLVMPVGRLAPRHALIGGIAAGLLWELTRHALVSYFATLSRIQLVYGSFASAVALLLTVEIAAIVLLLGAQVIAEVERMAREPRDPRPEPMRTD